MDKFKVLDTFAGAGGFSLGFALAGHHVVGAVEIDKWACDTFLANHPDAVVIKDDISTLSNEAIQKLFVEESNVPDVIIGGPPCQGFSIANRRPGDLKDPRNSLFREFVRLGELFRPRLMIMENVPNLLKARAENGDKVIDIIETSLRELGYFVYSKVLQATDFGVPQMRTRLFVIASKVELLTPFPTPTHTVRSTQDLFGAHLLICPTLWDAISDLPSLNAGEGAEEAEYTLDPQNAYQKVLRYGSKILTNHKAMRHSKRIVERFASMQCGDTIKDVPAHLQPRRRNSNELAAVGYDQNNRRMHPDRICHTIPASFYANFVHPFQHRNFTAREGARVQSFPDWYQFKGKPTVVSNKLLGREGRADENYLCQYSQIGNAVPPLLAKAVAQHLAQQLSIISESKKKANLESERSIRKRQAALTD